MYREKKDIPIWNSENLLFLALTGCIFICTRINLSFGYEITFSITSIFLFLVFRLYGLPRTLLVGLLAILVAPHKIENIIDSNILIVEILFVGAFFYKGRKAKMFFVDVFFWITLGLLMVYFLSRITLSGNALYFQICKKIINGSFNVLIADMLLAYVPFYKVIKRINKNNVSIHQFLSHITLISIFIPFFINTMINLFDSHSQEQFYDEFLNQLKFSLLFALCTIVLVQILSRIFMNNLNQLTKITTELPDKLVKMERVTWPQSNVSEIWSLTQNLMKMAEKIKELFHESKTMNTKLAQHTESLEKSESKLHQLSFFDVLTGLPNRVHFQNYVRGLIQNDETKQHAIVFIDINQFKQINDTFGHDAGDNLLQLIAERLGPIQDESREVFRLGGDEFVIVHSFNDKGEIETTIEQVLGKFKDSFSILNEMLYVTASIGISMYPDDGNDLDTLVKCADIAMYMSKEKGGNVAQFFNETMRDKFREGLFIENALRTVLDKGGLELFYQPKTRYDQVTSMEVLLRWNDSELGFISPSTFIPIAEDIGLIIQMDEWTIVQACKQNKMWQDMGLAKVPVSVNLSAKHFLHDHLFFMIERALEVSGLDPQYLKLEITESVFIQDTQHVANVIHQLKSLGVHISIDDFGKGYSSLYQLLDLPIDEIKIDRQFIIDIDQNEKKELLVKSILNMAKGLHLNVVAEGIETINERDLLMSLGCNELQGYLFSPPVSETEMRNLLSNEKVSEALETY